MEIILVCGYRRTGKDTLYLILSGQVQDYNSWLVYGKKDTNPLIVDSSYQHVSFAQALKDEVAEIYGVTVNCDEDKDIKLSNGKTPRDYFIEHGAIRRSEDINYWVNKAKEGKSGKIIITDFRFVNEFREDDMSIRIYDSKITEPDANIESEHQLDNFTTNYLLVHDESDYIKALEKFPQYKDYTYIQTI